MECFNEVFNEVFGGGWGGRIYFSRKETERHGFITHDRMPRPAKPSKSATSETLSASRADVEFIKQQGNARYKTLSDIEHARLKSSDTGSPVPAPLWGVWAAFRFRDGALVHTVSLGEETMSEKLATAVREAFVNVSDVATSAEGMRRVTVCLDGTTFSIENDGVGIPVARAADGSWIPQNCFGRFKSGSNVKRARGTIVGGTNGIGIKLPNALSEWMEIRVVDDANVFRLRWEPMERPGEPEVAKRKRGDKPGVLVRFRLDRRYFAGCSAAVMEAMMQKCVHTLTALLAVYLAPRGVAVFLQDARLKMTAPARVNVRTIADMFGPLAAEARAATATVSFPISAASKRAGEAPLPTQKWEVLIAFQTDEWDRNFTIVNGTATYSGPHVRAVFAAIRDAVAARLKRNKIFRDAGVDEITLRRLEGMLAVAMICRVPDADWSDQCKTVLRAPQKYEVALPKAAVADVAAEVERRMQSQLKQKRDTKDTRDKIVDRLKKKHTAARYAGTAQSRKCVLVACEGTSPLNASRRVFIASKRLKNRPYWMNADFCGFYDLGGVIMNAWREATEVGEGVIMSKRMANNAPMRGLLEILQSRMYGHIVFATDADIDGEMIKCQLISFFKRMAPELFEVWDRPMTARAWQPRLYMWSTPVARGTRGKTVRDFFVEADIDPAAAEQRGLHMHYYKGLGAIEQTRDQILIDAMPRRLIQFASQKPARLQKMCDVWFGDDPETRKRAMTEPARGDVRDDMWAMLRREPSPDRARALPAGEISAAAPVPAEKFVEVYMRMGSIEKTQRTLKNVVDGLYEGTRKCVFAFSRMARPNEALKIFIRAGQVTTIAGYAHGDSSINEMLKGLGMFHLGGGTMPLARLLGQAPARSQGIKEGAAARYLEMKPNTALVRALFAPAELEPFFDNVRNFGCEWEPVHYVPLLPYAVMEYHVGVGSGWRQQVLARDPLSVAAAVTQMVIACDGRDVPRCPPMAAHTLGFDGRYWTTREGGRRVEWFEARWEYDETTETLHIHDVPYFTAQGVQTSGKWVAAMTKICEAERWPIFAEETVMNDVQVTVKVPAAEMRAVRERHGGVAEFFKLRASHRAGELNMVVPGRDGCELFATYGAMVERWFAEARELCERRWRRDVALAGVRLRLQRAKLRFVDGYEALQLRGGMKVSQMEARLREHGFCEMDEAFIKAPGKTVEPQQIEARAVGEGASFRYLLGMTTYDRAEKNRAALVARVEGLKKEIDMLRSDTAPFAGAARWLREIEHFRDVYKEGVRTNFLYEDHVQ